MKWWQIVVMTFILIVSDFIASRVGHADRTRPIRIGALTMAWGPTPAIVGLRDGLLSLGYREDADFFLGVRFTQGDIKALDAAAPELVQYGVDLIFTVQDEATKAARRATREIPIVFASVADIDTLDFIDSFARPGSNVTGVTDMELHLGPKRLQVFQDMLPSLERILFPYDAAEPYAVAMAKVYHGAAKHLGLEFIDRPVRSPKEAQIALANLRKDGVDGILAPWSASMNIPGLILEVTTQRRIPTMFSTAFFPEHGGLASYAPDSHETGRQAARLVHKILKGGNPADIPVEVNGKIEFVINLKVADQLGLTIDPLVLFQAHRLIR